MTFDCLRAHGKDLRTQPLYVRRNVIEDVLDEHEWCCLFAVSRMTG